MGFVKFKTVDRSKLKALPLSFDNLGQLGVKISRSRPSRGGLSACRRPARVYTNRRGV
jgi:hypothetical protein